MSGTSVKGGDGDRVPASEGSRHGRRRQRTRGRLVEAARRVIGRRGVEATTILDITREADVGFGTVYNYFDSKEAILAAATGGAAEGPGHARGGPKPRSDAARKILAAAARTGGGLVNRDPIWAWFVVRTSLYQEQMAAVHGHRLAVDLRRGVEQRRFPETDVRLLNPVIGGAGFGWW